MGIRKVIEWENPQPDHRWPIAVSRPIKAPASKVWDVISMPGNLELCHPFCESNIVEVWSGPDSKDQIHYLSGWIMRRHFCNWIEGIGYDLNIGREGGRTSFVSWRIKPIDETNSILRIAIYPHILQDIPVLIRWIPHFLYIVPKLRAYLESVTQGFDWYLTRGEPVPRNQFGSHAWFSTANPPSFH